jgi:Ni/Co efflux regulator RcnB
MPALVFNAHGYVFQSGLEILSRSYASAWSALAGDVERAADDAFGYQQALEEGAEFIGDRDEDGNVIWSREEELDHDHQVAEEALRTLRRAYVISMYHHWERGVRTWTGDNDTRGHAKMVKKLAKLGLQVHPKLEVVRIVTNLLKHDNDDWGQRLLVVDSGLVDQGSTRSFVPGWYDRVVLSDNHMTEFFNAVAASGPNIKTIFSNTP